MQAPRITKITLNMGVGGAVADKKVLQSALSDMEKFPVKNLLLHWQENRLPVLKFVTICLLVAK